MATRILSGVNGRAVLLPVGETVFVDVDVVELDAPELLREHVRILAIAAAAIDDDRKVLRRLIAALAEQLVHFLVDIRLPHRIRPRAGDVSLFIDRGTAGGGGKSGFVWRGLCGGG